MKPVFLSLCMIVKNEEKHLPRCLNSVKDVVDEMIIVDTGSRDETKKIALSFAAQVLDFEWVDDFSAARNVGLERASGEWILVLDADECLDEKSAAIIRQNLVESDADAYHCLLRNVLSISPQLYYHDQNTLKGWIRIFRNSPQYRFEGMYHESVYPSLLRHSAKVADSSFMIWHYGLLYERVQGEDDRNDRHWRYLQMAVEREPLNGNLLFYLGNEYYARGDFENAYKVLKRATLEVGTKLAHPYQTKLGLLNLATIASQNQEYELATGCARGSLFIQEYPELNPIAWQRYCQSFIYTVKRGINQANESPNKELKIKKLSHYLELIEEFKRELQNHLEDNKISLAEREQLLIWLPECQDLINFARQSLEGAVNA